MTDQRSTNAAAYRGWYKLARWRRLREWRLRIEPLCRMCSAIGRTTPAAIVDHVRPHRGEAGLFWDQSNTQSLCAECHDRHKQVLEKTGVLTGADSTGNPIDPDHHWN